MDGDGHSAAPGLPRMCVGDRALIEAAVVGRGRRDAEDVQDLIRKSLLHLNSIFSLRENPARREREKRSISFHRTDI